MGKDDQQDILLNNILFRKEVQDYDWWGYWGGMSCPNPTSSSMEYLIKYLSGLVFLPQQLAFEGGLPMSFWSHQSPFRSSSEWHCLTKNYLTRLFTKIVIREKDIIVKTLSVEISTVQAQIEYSRFRLFRKLLESNSLSVNNQGDHTKS